MHCSAFQLSENKPSYNIQNIMHICHLNIMLLIKFSRCVNATYSNCSTLDKSYYAKHLIGHAYVKSLHQVTKQSTMVFSIDDNREIHQHEHSGQGMHLVR